MGPYCNFCGSRCFVHMPMDAPKEAVKAYGSSTILATCPSGQALEKRETGWCYADILAAIDKPQLPRCGDPECDHGMTCRCDVTAYARFLQHEEFNLRQNEVAHLNALQALVDNWLELGIVPSDGLTEAAIYLADNGRPQKEIPL